MHLHSNIQTFQQVLENIPAAVAMLDRHMFYVAVSHQWLQDYGLHRQNLIGSSHYEVFPEDSANFKAAHQRCLAGASEEYETRKMIREDGNYERVKSEVFPWYEYEGEVGGIVICNKNISDEKQIEETLPIKNDDRFQKLAANLPGLIFQILFRADGLIYCPYVSLACSHFLGFEAQEIIDNQAFLDLIHPDDYQSFFESMMLSRDTLLPCLWEGRIITANGNYSDNYLEKYKWVRCESRPEKQNNGDILWDGLIIDIGDKIESEAKAKAKLKEELRQYQNELESKVQFRTAQLQQLNDQLQAQLKERNQVESALRKSEARFKKLVDNVPGMLYQYVMCPDGNKYFSYISPGCEEMYELKPETILQNPFSLLHLVYEDDKSLFEESLNISAQTLRAWNIEHRIITPSGNLKWVQGHSRPEMQVNGDIVWNGFLTDITERKEVEEERETFASLVENSSDFIAIATLEGRGWYLNRAGFQLVGFESMEEFLQTTIADYHTPEDWKFFEKVITPTVMEKGHWQGESKFKHFRTGKLIPIEYNIFLIKDPKTGKPTNIATVTRDISERKQSEAAIKQSEFRYKELARREQLLNRLAGQIRESLNLDNVLDTAMYEIRDLLQIDRCSFSWFTTNTNPPKWETIKEARNPDLPSLIGRHSIEKVGPVTELFIRQEILKIDDVAECEEPIHRQFLESLGIKSEIVLPIQTNTGRIGVIVCGHWNETRPWTESEVELLQAVVDQLAIAIQQAELYTQTQKTAVTAQKQARKIEQTLQELQRAQTQLVQSEKMSGLGQLVAGVAHEINNPVNFIYGNLEHAKIYTQDILQLLKLYQESYPEPSDEILDEIETIDLDFLISDIPNLINSMRMGAERIREIVQSLRIFSRLDEAEMKAVNIHEGIESTIMILQNRVKPRQDFPGIEILKKYGELPLITCYPGQLNQVFMNLLANAIDALEEAISKNKISNPTIAIATEIIDRNYVSIRISDNGVGIKPEVQKCLFDPFFTTKPVGVGTGLGLSISYQIIVDKHGGQLRCISELGKGTEFIVDIPLSQPGNS